LEKFIVW